MTDENLTTEQNTLAEGDSADHENLEITAVNEVDDAVTEESATVTVTQQPVDSHMLRKIVEGAILAAAQPLTITRLLELFDEEVRPSKEEVLAALQEIEAACADRGYQIKEVASGWRFQVREETAPWVNRMWEEKPQKYSRALLETLALIAYRQPITRGDIEEIRGVAVSSHIMKTLMERDWVKVVGHRDVPGRPSLYATTRQFLDYFNLKSLEELPSLSEIRDLDELNNVLNLGDEEGLGEQDEDLTAESAPADVLVEDAANEEEPEEFVDGEEAFVDIEVSDVVADENTAINEANAGEQAAVEEDTDEEQNNA
jgi:segregation and condensation protein B